MNPARELRKIADMLKTSTPTTYAKLTLIQNKADLEAHAKALKFKSLEQFLEMGYSNPTFKRSDLFNTWVVEDDSGDSYEKYEEKDLPVGLTPGKIGPIFKGWHRSHDDDWLPLLVPGGSSCLLTSDKKTAYIDWDEVDEMMY